jgi:hypothetical protein
MLLGVLAILITGIVFAARPSPAVASKCELIPKALTGVALPGVDSAQIGELAQVCQVIQPDPSPAMLPNGARRAVRAIANLLVASKNLDDRNSLYVELRKVLPEPGARLCDQANVRFKEKTGMPGDLTVACFRPTCIEDLTAPACSTLPRNQDAIKYSFSFHKDLSSCDASKPCKPKVDMDAVSIGLSADILREFLRRELDNSAELKAACGAGDAAAAIRCSAALLASIQEPTNLLSEQAKLIEGLRKLPPPTLQSLREANSFKQQWEARMPSTLETASRTSQLYYLDSAVLTALRAQFQSYQAAIDALDKKFDDLRFSVANALRGALDSLSAAIQGRRADLPVVFPEAERLKRLDTLLDAWRDASRTLSETDRPRFLAVTTQFADALQRFEEPLALLSNRDATIVSDTCKATQSIDSTTGVFDLCFGQINKDTGAVGLRFSFAPCVTALLNALPLVT